MSHQEIRFLEMSPEQCARAGKIAEALGYTEHAYCSSSGVPGIYCMRTRLNESGGVVVLADKHGFWFIQDGEDLNMGLDFEELERGQS